ncbi:hypothetical protein D3C84_313440 [compost metagenome]|jgi:hypothetical protein
MYSRRGVNLENQGIRLAMGGQWPRSDPDCVRQLIDEWCSLRNANISLVNLSAIPVWSATGICGCSCIAGVHVSALFCARGLVFSKAYTYSERALGKVLKGMPWLADNTGSQGLVRLFRSTWGALSMRRCLMAWCHQLSSARQNRGCEAESVRVFAFGFFFLNCLEIFDAVVSPKAFSDRR